LTNTCLICKHAPDLLLLYLSPPHHHHHHLDARPPSSPSRPKLSGTLFQKDLGSLLDKSDRCEALVAPLSEAMAFPASAAAASPSSPSSGVRATAARAAHLAKADLATATVMEMTALAGTMGRHYAQHQVSSIG